MTFPRDFNLIFKAIFIMAFGVVIAGPVMAEDPVAAESNVIDDHGMPAFVEDLSNGAVVECARPIDDHKESSGGLPQLHFYWYPSQILSVFVAFSILFLVFSRIILPGISGTIETRRNSVQKDLDTAESLKDKAEQARQTYEALLKLSNQKAMDLMVSTDQALSEKYAASMDSFRDTANTMISETDDALQKTKEKLLVSMHDVAAEVASLAANKIIGIPADVEKAKSVVISIYKKAA